MMAANITSKLQIVTLLDSICYGLIYGFISPYVLSLSRDHLIVGVMSVGNLLCSLISADIINYITHTHGKQDTFIIVLSITLISYLLMVSTNSYWLTIFSRYIYSSLNQSQNLCKDILLKRAPKDEQEHFLTNYSILSGAGYLIGPFISGMLFDTGFLYIGLLAATLTGINIFIIMNIPRDADDLPTAAPDEKTLIEKTCDNVTDVVHNITKSDIKKNWDIITLKFLYISSISIFFSKFTQILKHNFKATAYDIGYTCSYMNTLTFVGTYLVNNIKDQSSNYPMLTLANYTFQLLTTATLIACYSPIYALYAIMCIPIIFSTSYINSVWKNLFAQRNNESLQKINNSIGIVAGLTIPLAFGVVCNLIGHHAAILFSVLPLLVAIYIINKYIKQYKVEEQSDKSKNE